MTESGGLSKTEIIKRESDHLRGRVTAELAADTNSFEPDTNQVLKHHGTYQQDDRDRRKEKLPDGSRAPKAFSMMVRSKVPGGKLTSRQLLDHLDICEEFANATLRITTRQTFQLHGVLKRDLKQTIRRINEIQLTTFGGCGDVGRNVMCCPAPFCQDAVRDRMQELAARLSAHFLPRTTAYREIWLTDLNTGEKQRYDDGHQNTDVEPLYGSQYLPRKFKLGIGLPGDNCVDVYTHDLGFLAIVERSSIVGYNVLAGGGMGVTPSKKETFPALARPLAFVAPEDVVGVSEAVVKVYRDFGGRVDRRRARLKYLIADWGLERFKAKVQEYYGRPLSDPRPVDVRAVDNHLGWHDQGDGRLFYGLNVENGRIADRDGFRLKSAIREICRAYQPGIRLTPDQSLLLTDVTAADRKPIEDVLRRHGLKLHDEISNVRQCSMACVALPTCPLAITESERVLPELIDQLERELAKLGLEEERFTTRMTGCPNGCARPYNAEVGLVGRSVDKYAVYLGGGHLGDRLAFLYKDRVPLAEIVPTLVPVLHRFKRQCQESESFGDFCNRKGADGLAEAHDCET